jgi:hypothetical protein
MNTTIIVWRNSKSGAVVEVTLHRDRDAAEYYQARATRADLEGQIFEGVRVLRAPDLRPYGRGKGKRKKGEKY